MRRRAFITLLGGSAVAWPLAARAQQPAMPVIGFLNVVSPDGFTGPSARISSGPEGNRLCRGRERGDRIPLGRLPSGSTAGAGGRIGSPTGRRDRYERRPAPALAAKAATTTIPIVFGIADDPVRLDLVASLARPGGNLTGSIFSMLSWRQSGWGSCASLCPEQLVWPCSSTRPVPQRTPR